jgi:nicotinate-nucleotide--dimethylbenzimidazole phosphoribosyltransferase
VEAAENRMAILFDDGVTGAAVLAAVTVYPEIRSAVFPTLIYHEPVHEMQMKSLGMEGMIDLDITGGAGLGSVMGLSLLMAAMSMMEHMKTFEETGVAGREEKGDGK